MVKAHIQSRGLHAALAATVLQSLRTLLTPLETTCYFHLARADGALKIESQFGSQLLVSRQERFPANRGLGHGRSTLNWFS